MPGFDVLQARDGQGATPQEHLAGPRVEHVDDLDKSPGHLLLMRGELIEEVHVLPQEFQKHQRAGDNVKFLTAQDNEFSQLGLALRGGPRER